MDAMGSGSLVITINFDREIGMNESSEEIRIC